MKRALVTGGTGFVGNNLARRLLRDGHEVHLLVRPGHASWRLADLPDDVRLRVAPLDDADAVARALQAIRPDWVFHLAAHGAYSWQVDRRAIVQTNIVGTLNLLEASLAVGFEAFVNAGSSSEYGYKDHAPAETDWLEPNSDYAVAKASATLFCRHVALREAAPVRTLRLYSVFGPYEDPGRLMPTLVTHALRGTLPPLVDPAVARDYVFADDVTDAFLLAASTAGQAPGAVYNVGSGVQTSLADVVAIARRIFQIADEPHWGSMPNRRWDTSTWVANNRTIRSVLGWEPSFSVEDGLVALADWFRADPARIALYSERGAVPR